MPTIQALGAATAKGTRPSQQDAYTILPPEQFLPKADNNLALFAVYDGHGSGIVSKHASQHLPSLLTQSLTSSALNPESYESAIKSAISSEEEQIVQAFKDGEEEYAFAGSTLALVLLDLKSGTLFTGNMGDSKVFLGTLDSGDQVEDVKCLTKSHKPSSPDEKQRIENAGGTVLQDQHEIPRIGALNMSRALGDLEYKTPFTNLSATNPDTNEETPLTREQARAGVEPSKKQGDLLSSEPDITRINLDQGKKYVLALVSDGVSDSPNVDDEGFIQMLAKGFTSGIRGEAVVREVIDQVVDGIQSDNATCVGVLLQ
ncbi:PP2C family serine/threonine-protein phosphatase [Aspergillus ruber CBS 135680]|uniref:Protein serine/threonine phosphatase 2C n=1 Tax=Aspergillus ruber (strain CBS 135680) TaxID=1388766 RepID=A0A017SB86_ASPRC|nr:protein serine/threonine phosphatase 2C [Aspergillus ruber CBS 135680]EYE94308.1 protein serine/threonine phosphatase 2C [Aspergillus ruber CBS 135680]